MLAVCSGPILGTITDRATWKWCFWVWVALVLDQGGKISFKQNHILRELSLSLCPCLPTDLKISEVLTRVPLSKRSYVTWMGLGTRRLIGAVACLLLALQWRGQIWPWNSGRVICLLIGVGTLLTSFGFLQRKLGEHATIPLRILR